MLVYKFRTDGVYENETMEVEGPGWPAGTTPDAPPELSANTYAKHAAGIWTVIQGEIPAFVDNRTIELNKQQAIGLLSQTDWVEVPSVANTAINPHLTNVAEFLTYRNQLRVIAVNPTANVTWPTMPTEQWSS